MLKSLKKISKNIWIKNFTQKKLVTMYFQKRNVRIL
jgi:hypothetical protein